MSLNGRRSNAIGTNANLDRRAPVGESEALHDSRRNPLPKEGHMKTTYLNTLPTPPAIDKVLAHAGSLKAGVRKQLLEDLKLSFYFGGLDVACKATRRGLVIVASGPSKEILDVLNTLSQKERAAVTIIFPERWESMLADVYHHRLAPRPAQ